jgi:hypothetical protein
MCTAFGRGKALDCYYSRLWDWEQDGQNSEAYSFYKAGHQLGHVTSATLLLITFAGQQAHENPEFKKWGGLPPAGLVLGGDLPRPEPALLSINSQNACLD